MEEWVDFFRESCTVDSLLFGISLYMASFLAMFMNEIHLPYQK